VLHSSLTCSFFVLASQISLKVLTYRGQQHDPFPEPSTLDFLMNCDRLKALISRSLRLIDKSF
jgi:hypothetical protein